LIRLTIITFLSIRTIARVRSKTNLRRPIRAMTIMFLSIRAIIIIWFRSRTRFLVLWRFSVIFLWRIWSEKSCLEFWW
jgi:hypothetical protein